jgi:hypothetical protein
MVKDLYRVLKEIYPSKTLPPLSQIKRLEDIIALKLSHFTVEGGIDFDRCIDFTDISHINIQSGWMTKNEYIDTLVPLIDIIQFSHFLHAPTLIPYTSYPHLEIHSVCINNTITKPSYIHTKIEKPLSYASNHFVFFRSLDLTTDSSAIRKELRRLELTRDSHKTLHFHLYKGGDTAVVHAILRCLCGKREPWMTSYTTYDSGGSVHIDNISGKKTVLPIHKDVWNAEEDFPILPVEKTYSTKYSGDIVVHVNFSSASAAWYLLTYLIYAFATKITRTTRQIYGVPVKIGRVSGLTIKGYSLTTSGDAHGTRRNDKARLFGKDYSVKVPSVVLERTSVKENDYLRFWLPTD